MEMKITVFTPTYNRAYCLRKVYDSLMIQNNKSFQWVLMDDGSTDNTEELARKWMAEADFPIIYLKQENQGRFAAFNNAEKYFNGKYTMIVDSDDVLLPGAIEKIIIKDSEIGGGDAYSGLISYYEDSDGDILGTSFPVGIVAEKLSVLYDKYNMTGDKFLIFKTDIIKEFQYPIYQGEKFGGDELVFDYCCDVAPLYIFPEKLVHLESQADSITNNLLKYHLNSPNGMREHYNECLRTERYNKKNILKHAIGYTAFSYLTDNSWKYVLDNSYNKFASIITAVPGYLYYLRLKRMKESGIAKT